MGDGAVQFSSSVRILEHTGVQNESCQLHSILHGLLDSENEFLFIEM